MLPRLRPQPTALSSRPPRMPLLRLKLAYLQTLSAPSAESLGTDGAPGDSANLEARIRRQFRFLPDPITVKVEGDEVKVEFPEETPGSRAEAARTRLKD